jgi:hypothetical protein
MYREREIGVKVNVREAFKKINKDKDKEKEHYAK